MALVVSSLPFSSPTYRTIPKDPINGIPTKPPNGPNRITLRHSVVRSTSPNNSNDGSIQNPSEDEEVKDLGVRAALCMLKFYKREISPLLPSSCRYVPTCSVYSMEAYKKYGVAKGTMLTAWRLCRCNPLGGSGFDPPRWFDEGNSSDQ